MLLCTYVKFVSIISTVQYVLRELVQISTSSLHDVNLVSLTSSIEVIVIEMESIEDDTVRAAIGRAGDMWVKEIRNLVQETSVYEAKNETGEPTQSLDMEKTRATPKKSKKQKSEDESESSNKNPKQKMPRRDSSTKKKSPKKSIVSTAELDNARAAAKKKFEEEKARILAEVPEEHKNKWGQVGFAKCGKEWNPCLIVSPYDASPRSVMRKLWMKMFENVSINIHSL